MKDTPNIWITRRLFKYSTAIVAASLLTLTCGLDTDRDGDGYYAAEELEGLRHYDCDDYDPDFNEGFPFYRDEDGDGLGEWGGDPCYVCYGAESTPPPSTQSQSELSCDESISWVYNDHDCDDSDDELGKGVVYYRDNDGDGYGDPSLDVATYSCPLSPGETAPTGYVDNPLDCDDSESSDSDVASYYYLDSDGDGYGGDISLVTCDSSALPEDYTSTGEDCDDDVATINPGEADCENGRDDDCDEREDEDEARTWYFDGDGDGYGDPLDTQSVCPPDEGYIDTGGDCDDDDDGVYPGVEDCDSVASP